VLNIIGPTLAPAGKSFVIIVCNAPDGNTRDSPAPGIPVGDQFAGSDQFALTAPVHERVDAKRGKETKRQNAARKTTKRLWTMTEDLGRSGRQMFA
jgi:hypothetical protein